MCTRARLTCTRRVLPEHGEPKCKKLRDMFLLASILMVQFLQPPQNLPLLLGCNFLHQLWFSRYMCVYMFVYIHFLIQALARTHVNTKTALPQSSAAVKPCAGTCLQAVADMDCFSWCLSGCMSFELICCCRVSMSFCYMLQMDAWLGVKVCAL